MSFRIRPYSRNVKALEFSLTTRQKVPEKFALALERAFHYYRLLMLSSDVSCLILEFTVFVQLVSGLFFPGIHNWTMSTHFGHLLSGFRRL